MEYLSAEQLDFSNRIRKLFDETRIQELATSIAEKGLMHPLVVTSAGHFVAGERRFRAMSLLHQETRAFHCNNEPVPPAHYPCIRLEDLDEDARLEAELEENVLREDLTWQERAGAESALHQLRLSQRGAYHIRHNPDGQSIAATAAEISGQPNTNAGRKQVSDSVILAKHLDDPAIAASSTKAEAMKKLRAKAIGDLTSMLAERVDTSASRHQVVEGSCLDFTEEGVFDCICTDPPYGIDAGAFGSQTSVEATHSYDDKESTWAELMIPLVPILWNACKPQAHVYIFTAFDKLIPLQMMLLRQGFRVWPRPIIWSKGNQGLLPDATHGPRYCHDYVLYALKGNKPVERILTDVIPGSLVWDPFCGAGGIFPAANKLKLRAVGHDIDPAAIAIAKTRLQEGTE
jgi:hypothetical protein